MLSVRSTRWKMVWMLTFISMLRSMDSVNFSVAAKHIMPEFNFTQVQVGFLYTAYAIGYAAFHLPGGLLADRFGPKRVLGLALVWWSAFTSFTALAPHALGAVLGPFASFQLARFLVGIGEGACYPAASRMIANWMKPDERGTAGGLVTGIGIGIGSAVTPPIVAYTMVHYGWRMAFYAFAALGIPLVLWWYRSASDSPEAAPAIAGGRWTELHDVERAPQASKGSTPWGAILSSPDVWLLCVAEFCFGYGIFVYQSWFYLYLVNVLGFSEISGGFFTAGPFILVALFSPVGGWFSDVMVRRHGTTAGRRIATILGFVLSAACIAVGARTQNAYLAVFLLSMGDGFLYFSGSSSLAAIIDLGGSHAGVTYGITVSAVQLGGIVAPTVTPILAERFGWQVAIYVMAVLAAVASLLWTRIDAARSVESRVRVARPLPPAVPDVR